MRLIRKLILVVAVLAALYVAAAGLDVWRTSKRSEHRRSDAIVVMGAAQYDGAPSRVFQARLDHARVLYKSRVAPLIVVLGGKRAGDRFTEAQAGAAYLEKTLPADKVTGVKAGKTTLDSLRKFTGLAKERRIESIVLVSDPLHLARAQEMAEDLGFETAVSASSLPQTVQGQRSGLVQETARLLYYRVFREG